MVNVKIPIGIFKDRVLSPLESASEYFKGLGMKYSEIAELLNRDDRTIWTCVNRAKKKREKTGTKMPKPTGQKIPVSIFHNRDLAPLEGISCYLKDKALMSYHEIAVELNRDDRTIWTSYNRALKKLSIDIGKDVRKNGGGAQGG